MTFKIFKWLFWIFCVALFLVFDIWRGVDTEAWIVLGVLGILCYVAHHEIYSPIEIDAQGFALSPDAARRFMIQATKDLPFRKIDLDKVTWKMPTTQAQQALYWFSAIVFTSALQTEADRASKRYPMMFCGQRIHEDPNMRPSRVELYHGDKLLLGIEPLFAIGDDHEDNRQNPFHVPAPQH